MTGQRTWVCTLDGDAVAVDQIVQYTPEEGAATGRTVLTAIARGREAQREAGLRLDGPETA